MSVIAKSPIAQRTAEVVNKFLDKAKDILSAYSPANMLLLRGFDQKPQFPSMSEIYKLKPVGTMR